MTSQTRFSKSAGDELPAELTTLANLIARLPDEQRRLVEPCLTEVIESMRRRKRILNLVQEALGQLRVDMKYLVFDLEATRRERDRYRQGLEGGNLGEP